MSVRRSTAATSCPAAGPSAAASRTATGSSPGSCTKALSTSERSRRPRSKYSTPGTRTACAAPAATTAWPTSCSSPSTASSRSWAARPRTPSRCTASRSSATSRCRSRPRRWATRAARSTTSSSSLRRASRSAPAGRGPPARQPRPPRARRDPRPLRARFDAQAARLPPVARRALGDAGRPRGSPGPPARGAIADLVELASTRKPLGSSRSLAERSATQAAVAEAEAALRAARLLYYTSIDDAWQAAQGTEPVPDALKLGLRLAATHVTRTAAKVAESMYDLGGGAAIYETSPLQRRFRDAHTATAHFQVNPASFELPGKLLLGVPARTEQL
ncbi:acyl-CoA dehydrogenase family protein [Amycolatopsis sp. MEPSY49]|uniref:acyl-CoA dehydrogenase family protein n=1 Tax=Amycolatopsis sp. MEPSY49 TaxID=3151600 RepID=UPI003F5160FB